MQLSETLRAELERRLTLGELERPEDPAYRDLPRIDLAWVLVLVAIAIAGVVVLQAVP